MKKFIAITALLFVTACGVSKTDGVVTREKNSSGFMGLSQTSDIKIDGESALKGIDKVVIGSFKVGFVESGIQERQAGGGLFSRGSGGNAKGTTKLIGVSEAIKQQITENAYNDFVAKLKNNGFSILNRADFTSSEQYASAKKYNFPYEADDSGFLSEFGVSRFYQPASFGDEGIMMMNDIPGVSGGFAFGNGQTASSEYATKNNLAVVSATYLVDFATAGGHGGRWSSTASVQVGQNLAVTSGSAKFVTGATSTFSPGVASLSIGQPIEAGKEFATIEDVTSDTDTAVRETLNVISVLAGGGTNRKKDFTVKANPAKYKKYSTEILKDANAALITAAGNLK